MAGIPSGRINCLSVIPAIANQYFMNGRSHQERFVSLWKYLAVRAAAGKIDLIASNYGVNAGATGVTLNTPALDYWDNPSGNWLAHGAFSVWYFKNAQKPWYLLIQLNLGGNTAILDGVNMLVVNGQNPPNDMLQLGIQAAWAEDASGNTANPWNGTTNADGNDRPYPAGQPNSPRWAAPPGGKVYVLPRENSDGGNYAATKKSCAGAGMRSYYENYTNYAYGVVCDDDSIAFYHDPFNSNEWSVSLVTRYTPRSGYTIPRPYMMLTQAYLETDVSSRVPFAPFTNATGIYGLPTFTSYNDNSGRQGGILIPSTNANDNPRRVFIDRYQVQSNAFFNPANASGTNRYDEWQLIVGAYENSATPDAAFAVLGDMDPFYREVYNVGSSDTNANLSRVFLGGTTALASIKASLPWDGVTTPRNYGAWPASREGVTF